MSEPIKVDIWSDIACPWCFIGKRKFERGAAEFSEAAGDSAPEVVVEYHSYELAPDTPVDFDGDEVEFLAGHKGMDPAQVQQMLARVTGIAEATGLDYNFDILKHTNTIKAHELMHFAKAQGKQLEMGERLFSAYFTEGRHVGRVDDLVDLAAEIGLDRDEARSALESNRYLADVDADKAQAMQYGIQGVPFFVVDGKYGVSGAQEAQTFAQVLGQVWSERAEVEVQA
ncbi:DsbA family oxidoreductase [Compostimonas suwonensis]|uniref:Putative DsbA family dithiol-disulfide isomerase n=1 Tax=Compostimonas suwonensis TaxID=1048394 RepID=A0A2M9BZ37_9MICO|nr:DsbA family oxidoreductase [Compostimonas suwonensis]PJJ63344.1 putative DsbA family dithiol-disulfide isomerase [Compostimonas suwonensis]